MITKGSKIKLVKAMGEFNNIGEVCDVIKVTEDGVISFKFGNGMHLGCMSFDEYGKYFVDYVEPQKITREWSSWEYDYVNYCEYTGEPMCYDIKVRDNGKKVQLVCTEGIHEGLKAESTCCDSDEFDYDKGYDLAYARLIAKMAKRDADLLAKDM